MKEIIFEFLDKNYPIRKLNKIYYIDISFDNDTTNIVKHIFGESDITFKDWVKHKCGNKKKILIVL